MKKLIVISLLTIFMLTFAACGKRYEGSPSYTILSAEQISNFIQITNKIEILENNIFINDEFYAVPTLKWVTDVYNSQLTKFLFDNDLLQYIKEGNDCDDFSQYAISVAHMTYRYSSTRQPGTTISIGDVIWMQPLGDHAINVWIVTDEFGKLALAFYEPQKQQVISINTRDEIIRFLKM